MKIGSRLLVPVLATVVLLLAACGSVSSSSGSQGATSSNALAQAKSVVQSAEQTPKFSQYKPSKPAPSFTSGMHIALVNGNAKSTAAALQAQGVEQAAAAVGWTTQQYDGMGTSSGKITAFENALATRPNGVVLLAVDQQIVSAGIRQATTAGIPVVSTMAGNTQGTSPTQVFADLSGADYQSGVTLGDWVVTNAAGSHTTANILEFEYPINNTVIHRDQGWDKALSACSNCHVVDKVQYSSADLQQLTASVAPAIETHPSVKYVMIDIGAYATYVVKAIQAMGGSFANNIKLVSYDCVPFQIAHIRSGVVEAACDGQASVYSGWGAVDQLNRALHHQTALSEYVPSMLVTKSAPATVTDSTGFNGGFNFAANWKTFWGLK